MEDLSRSGELNDIPEDIRDYYLQVFGQEVVEKSVLIDEGIRRFILTDIEQYMERITDNGGSLLSTGVYETPIEKVLVAEISGSPKEIFFVIEHIKS